MSFKAADDGDLFTLDEALAFIDSCESESQDDDARSSASVAHLTEPISLEGIDELLEAAVHGPTKTPSPTHSVAVQAASPARKKKRVRSAASSSTVLQRRKRAELQSLRDQAAELEAYLAHLKGAGGQQTSLVAMKDAERLSPWQQHALLQYEQRQQSELTNRRLRETLEKQLKTANKLRGVLQKRNLLDVRGSTLEFASALESDWFLLCT
jgi:nitroreductase